MNRTEILELVLGRLGRQENNSYLLAQAKTELSLIQERLEGAAFLPWFLLSAEDTTLATTADVREVPLPTSFLREYEDIPLYRYDSTAEDPYIRLIKDEFDYLEARFGLGSGDIPTHYAVVGSSIFLFPTPDDAYPLRWAYYEKQTVLSDQVVENKWTQNAADLLVAELGVVMATYRRNEFLLSKFAGDVVIANNRLLAFDEARRQAQRDAYRGDK